MKKEIIVDGKAIKVDEYKLNKLIEESKNVRKPAKNEKYWNINSDASVYYTYWNDGTIDNSLYSIGNCFKTKEEAEFALEKLKVITELKRFALENNEEEIDWNNKEQDKYYIWHDQSDKSLHIDITWEHYSNEIFFTSEEIAKDAIKSIGEERLKKYYLEVK